MSDKVKAYFEDFPKSNKCFETTDGYIFHQEGDANLHAGSLASKQVMTHARPFEKEVTAVKAGKGKAATKGAATEEQEDGSQA